MAGLCFKDIANIYKVRKDGYSNDIPEAAVPVPAIYEQATGFAHGDHQDAVTSGSRLFLPADHSFVTTNGYRLEGMVAQVNLFGFDGTEQYFRITSVTPIRDTLLCNEVQHVECSLEKLERFDNGCAVS